MACRFFPVLHITTLAIQHEVLLAIMGDYLQNDILPSQSKHPWCKKSCSQESKKGYAEKDLKSKWAAKASCC